jgi:hypothetical protein
MDRQCMVCNVAIHEEYILKKIEFDYLASENLFKLQEIDPGVYDYEIPAHLQGGQYLVLSEHGDWRHVCCQAALGSGMTAEEQILQLWKGIQDLLNQ